MYDAVQSVEFTLSTSTYVNQNEFNGQILLFILLPTMSLVSNVYVAYIYKALPYQTCDLTLFKPTFIWRGISARYMILLEIDDGFMVAEGIK